MADKNLLQHLRDGVRLKELAQQEFVRAMRTGRMIAFVGSYATEELGYPKWSKLLKDLLPRLSSPISNRKMKKLYGALDKTTENSPIDYEILRDWIGIDPGAVGSSESALSDEEYRKGIAKTVIHGDTEIPDDNKTSVSHICDDLNIRKIITLNYDLEFEFHLMPHVDMPDESATDLREKFRNGIAYERDKWVKKRLERVDIRSAYDYQVKRTLPDGRHTISDCFHRERSDRLFEFAIGSPDYDFHIMHLHGRITDPETMVVGYSSYEDLYRRRDVTKLPFEHAMRMLFAGNPVLFVGLGMTEDEVLTALRQFVSDKRPDHIAPHFVIWNAYHGRKVQWKGKVSPEDELRRLRWYRRFGIHLIYDTELGDYFAEAPRKELRLRSSVLSLAKFAQTEVRPFGWKPEQLRGMKCFLPVGGESKVDDSDSWKTGSIVWPVVSDTSKIFMPTFEVAETPNINDRSVREFADNEYLDHILRNGPPIKAFVDAPGTGHGYLANVIKDFVTGKVRSGLLKNDQELIYFQINAGFAWEIDTTFALVSALYDHKLAFDTAIPAEKRSRQAANGEWSSAIRAKIRTQSKGPAGRNIVIVINGADRFFDTSGYPLSNELDMLLRSVPLLTQNPDPTSSYYGWKDGANKNYHPLTLLLFGTHRIERYLRSLAIPDLSHAAKLGSDGKSLKIPSFEFFHQDSAVASVVPGRSRSLTKRIIEQHILAETLGTTTKLLPLRTKLNDFSSAFLRLTEASFLSAYNTVQSTCLTEFPHDVGIQTLLEQSKNRSVGEQRRAFFDAYLRTETLKKVVANGSSEKVKLYLGLIRLLAFVGQPVEAATLDALKGTQPLKSLLKDAEPEAVNSALKDLKTLNLVSEIGPFPDSPVEIPNRYALHRALLHEIRDRNTVPISDARTYTSFNLPLYAAQPIDDHEPEQSVQEELEALVDTLIAPGPREDIGARPYGSRLRAAAASIRSYHTTSSMLMHEPPPAPYDAPCPRMGDHAKRLDDLIRAMEKVATAQEGKADQPKCAFPEDLVWLHDQRGVALLAQGSLYDARHALDQASTINDAFVEIGDHEQNWSRIEMNKLHLDIERGKISHAESRIRKIEEAINARSDKLRWSDLWQVHESDSPIPPFAMDAILLKYGKSLRSRIRVVDPIFPAEIILLTGVLCGYKGWCEYIRGRLKTSEHFFEQSIQILRNIGELRAYAMFMRHYTSVLYALDDREGAMKTINLCIAAADSARQMDISHLAWINRAELQLAFGTLVDRGSALRQMLATLRYATLTDMFRVRMETRRALAKLRLAEGDYDGALEQAAEAMAIATRFGYSLRKVSLRILIGQILVRRGDPISGYAMLDQATRIADRIGYQRAVEHAHAIRTDPSMPPAG